MVVIGNRCRNQNKKGFGEGLKFTILNRSQGVFTSGSCGGATGVNNGTVLFSLFFPPLLLPGRMK